MMECGYHGYLNIQVQCQLKVSVTSLTLPPHCGCVSLPSVCLVIFDWVTDTVNLTLLGAQYVCVPIIVHEYGSGMQLSCL